MSDAINHALPNTQPKVHTQHRSVESTILSFWTSLDRLRADRADLRRCRNPVEVTFTPAFHRLFGHVCSADLRPDLERLAVLAAALANIEQNQSSTTFPVQLATGMDGRPPLSTLRFRRLLAIDGMPELQTHLVRAIRLLGRQANVVDLAFSILSWDDDTKKRWAFHYYGKIQEKK
jgi:CRISPR system Cascade subunit CasB